MARDRFRSGQQDGCQRVDKKKSQCFQQKRKREDFSRTAVKPRRFVRRRARAPAAGALYPVLQILAYQTITRFKLRLFFFQTLPASPRFKRDARRPHRELDVQKHRITTFSYDEKARDNVRAQLAEMVGDIFTIRSYSCEEYLTQPNLPTDKVILLTAPMVEEMMRGHLPEDAAVFIATRSIDPSALVDIISIPHGADVLVVNNTPRNTHEVMVELQVLGFDYLNLVPFEPGKDYGASFQYAITPDEEHLVPPSIPHVFNIKQRHISIITMAQLQFYFNQSEITDFLIAQRYAQPIVKMSGDIFREQKMNMILKNYMDILLSNIDDGTIITDMEGTILFCNNKANSMLSDMDLIGKNVFAITDMTDDDSQFINSEAGIIYIARTPHETSSKDSGFIVTLKNADSISEIDNKLTKYKKNSGFSAKFSFSNIVHQSRSMKGIIAIAERFARKESTILLAGESGTGKELFAQALHNASLRKDGPFVAFNCAALSENLLESELFGYEEGAFTGATKGGKKGLFETANNGTIFLDEVGDAPMSIQTKMLRVLQEREIMRISGNRTIPVNVRVIAATNKDLLSLVSSGKFREDLYYRLNVVNLNIPPLREREGDIDLLLDYFLKQYGGSVKDIDERTLALLRTYAWPGNIRELRNIVEYTATVIDITPSLYDDVAKILRYRPQQESALLLKAERPLLFRSPSLKAETLEILGVLREARENERVFGREKLRQILEQKGIPLSIQQVKTRLAKMQQHDLIETTTGRGTWITEQGAAYLAQNSPPDKAQG